MARAGGAACGSAERESAVDVDHLARDVARFIGVQQRDQRGDVGRLGNVAKRCRSGCDVSSAAGARLTRAANAPGIVANVSLNVSASSAPSVWRCASRAPHRCRTRHR